MAMTSFASNIPIILDIIATVRPKKILDIGSGFGKFGLMSRELLLSIKAEETGDIVPEDDIVIDCAEESRYFTEQIYHDAIYDSHWHADARSIPLKALDSYDLILLIDVVEHWDKEIAKQWLSSINANILISTPKKVSFYEKKYYNSRKHISQWSADDLDGDDYSSEKSFIFLKKKHIAQNKQ